MKYTVTASRWERGWELRIEGVGATQSRGLADAEKMVRSYLRMDFGEEAAAAAEIEVVPVLEAGLAEEIGAVARRDRRAGRQATGRSRPIQRVGPQAPGRRVERGRHRGRPQGLPTTGIATSPQNREGELTPHADPWFEEGLERPADHGSLFNLSAEPARRYAAHRAGWGRAPTRLVRVDSS